MKTWQNNLSLRSVFSERPHHFSNVSPSFWRQFSTNFDGGFFKYYIYVIYCTERIHVFKISIRLWVISLFVDFSNMVLSTRFLKKNTSNIKIPFFFLFFFLLEIIDVLMLFDVIKLFFPRSSPKPENVDVNISTQVFTKPLTQILLKKAVSCVYMHVNVHLPYLACINTFDFSNALQLQNIISFI